MPLQLYWLREKNPIQCIDMEIVKNQMLGQRNAYNQLFLTLPFWRHGVKKSKSVVLNLP